MKIIRRYLNVISLCIVLYGIVGCGGSSSTPPTPSIPPAQTCESNEMLVSGMCVPTGPPQCSSTQILINGICETRINFCPSGQVIENNRCATIREIVADFLAENNVSSPCGLSKYSTNDIIDYDVCARSHVSGYIQLQSAVEAKVIDDMAAGREIPITHIHVDDHRVEVIAIDVPGVNPYTTHGVRSGYVLETLYGKTLFDTIYQLEDVEVGPTGSVARNTKEIINTFLSENVVISSGTTFELNCDRFIMFAANVNSLLCPNRFENANAVLVLGAGNAGRSNFDARDRTDQGSEIDIQNLVDINAPFLLAVGWENDEVLPIVNDLGAEQTVSFDSILNTVYETRELPELDRSLYEIAVRSLPCGEIAINHCVAAPWRSRYETREVAYEGGVVTDTSFTGTSNALLYVSSALALVRYMWPELTNYEILELVRFTSIDVGEEGPDPIFGLGLLSLADLFSPVGDIIDPITLLNPTAGSLALPLGTVSVKGIDSFNRDFTFQVGTQPFVPITPILHEVTEEYEGILPLLDQRGYAYDGFLYKKGRLFSSFRRENNTFLGGYGTGSYQLGDSYWITTGMQHSLGNFTILASATYGAMNQTESSLVEKLNAYYATVQIYGSKELTDDISLSLQAYYVSPIQVTYTIQNNGTGTTPSNFGVEMKFIVLLWNRD